MIKKFLNEISEIYDFKLSKLFIENKQYDDFIFITFCQLLIAISFFRIVFVLGSVFMRLI